MGCAQPHRVISPQNQIPIERIYTDRSPLLQSSPMLVPPAPSPSYVKSALKRDHFNGGQLNSSPLMRRDPMSMVKSVNFYETVLVRCRTPTPNKVWYEKNSTTMPMRRTPPNDDDDDDYEVHEENDVDEENDDDVNDQNRIPRLGTPIPFQTQRQWLPNELSPVPNRIKVRQRRPSSDIITSQPMLHIPQQHSNIVVIPNRNERLVQNFT